MHQNLTEPRDINSDNVLEIPMPIPLRSSSEVERSEGVSVINWVQFTVEGTSQSVGYTITTRRTAGTSVCRNPGSADGRTAT